MSNLKKGQLVMTEWGLAWYNGKAQMSDSRYFVLWLAGQSDAIDGTPIKATRTDVEAYLKEKGWELEEGNYVQLGNMYIIPPPLNGYYGFALEFIAYEPYFENAPAMQAEAILMARLLNATKDNLNL